MGRRVSKLPDEKIALKLISKALKNLGPVLVFLGRPPYLLLTYLILSLLFILYLVGRATRVLFLTLYQTTPSKLASKLRPAIGRGGYIYTKIVQTLETKKFKAQKRYLIFLRQLKLILAKAKFKVPKVAIPKNYIGVFLATAFLLLAAFFFWYSILRELPSPKELTTKDREVSTKIYDRHGVLLYKIYKNQNRTPVPLAKIPLHVRLATIASEDAEFYNHFGFSVRGILRSIIRNIKKGQLSGGSTITQQLVKNALLTPEKTLIRKVRELILSVATEFTYTKDAILEMYLNEVSYGGTAYGIEEASRLYFEKDVGNLTLGEAALLAGLPKSPTKYSPFGLNPNLPLARQKEVLDLMVVNKFITKEEAEAGKEEKITFAPNRIDIKAPHFVMNVRDILVEKYGEEVVEKGGLEVVTTLDLNIQKIVEAGVSSEINKLSRLHVGNGASLVLDPSTGEVLAMVGSKNYFDTASDGNVNVTTRPRQPGSSIKVVNYAYALSTNYSPASIISDTPVTFLVAGQPPYSPKNYDGNFRGRISLRSALAESRNIPAVKTLASYGVEKMIEMGRKMGITTWEDPSRFGLSLTLGGGEVKLIDLAKVYATIANYGKRPEIVAIKKVTNYKRKVLEENDCLGVNRGNRVNSVNQGGRLINLVSWLTWLTPSANAAEAARPDCSGEQVLDPRVAFLLIDILSDNSARAPSFGGSSQLVIPGHPEVVVKTGTSNDLRDNLTLGFNQKYLVAVWVGNNDNSPMARIASGVTGAAPIWNKIMSNLTLSEPSIAWQAPQDLVKLPVCSLTGTLSCKECSSGHEWFLQEKAPRLACNSDQIARILEEKKEAPKPGQILEPAARFP